jgi:hypothetical protein
MERRPMKKRLGERLSKPNIFYIRQALYAFLAKEDPEVNKFRHHMIVGEYLLPYLRVHLASWDTMTAEDLDKSNPLGRDFYHCVRNQFLNIDSLRVKVGDYIRDNIES